MEKAKSLAVASSKYLNTQVLSHFYTPTCQMMPNLSILISGGKENCDYTKFAKAETDYS